MFYANDYNKSLCLLITYYIARLREISGVWCFEREAGRHTAAYSTPGHLLHYIVKGAGTMITNGRSYNISPGSIVYYYEREEVKNYFRDDTVFYSVAFTAH